MEVEPRPGPDERAHATAVRAGSGLRLMQQGLASLVGVVVGGAAAVGTASFLTGWWVFDGSRPSFPSPHERNLPFSS